MEASWDPRALMSVPTMAVDEGIALGHAVLTAAPADLHPLVARELEDTRLALGALEAAWRPIAPAVAPKDTRPVDVSTDRCWRALVNRVEAWQYLPEGSAPEIAMSIAVQRAVWPDGLGFLKLAYARQWAECQRRLDLIDAQNLGPDIDHLAGPTFLAAVRAAHARYGVVLGITEAPAPPAEVPQTVQEPLRAFRNALKRYVEKLVGTTDDRDPQAVATALAALRPIEELRAAKARKLSKAKASEPTPAPAA